MTPRFHIDSPSLTDNPSVYSPMFVSGWFVDARLRGAVRVLVRLGSSHAICDQVKRDDVSTHFLPALAPAGNVGFKAQLPCPAGLHRLIIEAETITGEIIRLHDQDLTVKPWPAHPTGLLGRLASWRRRWTWTRPPCPDDSVLVLIPLKPGTPATVIDHARMLAERALKNLPAKSRIIFDGRGNAAARNEHPWRIQALASIRQGMIEEHLRDERWVFWADLDLADYNADLVSTLISRSEGGIVAPLVLMEGSSTSSGGRRFYDLAGFVEQGRWTEIAPPYFRQPGPVYDLDSVGCCYLIPASLYRRGARHEQDPGSRRWIETQGASSNGPGLRDWKNQAYTEHYSVCAFARQHGLPVRAFADLIALHEQTGC